MLNVYKKITGSPLPKCTNTLTISFSWIWRATSLDSFFNDGATIFTPFTDMCTCIKEIKQINLNKTTMQLHYWQMKKLTFSFGVYLYEPILIVLQFRNASMHCKAGEISFLLASERIKYISYQYRSHQYSEGAKIR